MLFARISRHPLITVAAILALFCAPLASAASRATPAERALSHHLSVLLAGPEAAHGFWGVYVYSLDRHRVVFAHNADRWFEPASNAKLFTLAAALQLLGPGYRFHTVVGTAAPPDAAGVVNGNVILIGSGDPSLSGRPYPYRYQPETPARLAAPPYDMMAVARDFASQIRHRGITRIRGDIVGDDTYYAWNPYPPGWADDDLINVYGAPVSALTINDNRRAVLVRPAPRLGAPATLTLDPAVGAPVLDNHVVTVPARDGSAIDLYAEPLSGAVRVEGHVAAGGDGVEVDIAVPDPALYAAQLLRQALIDEGIRVDGIARSRHRSPDVAGAADVDPAFILAQRTSPPLSQILQTTAKVSQNLHAELMLRLLGKLRGVDTRGPRGAATRGPAPVNDTSGAEQTAGEQVVHDFLLHAGLGVDDVDLVDGSGLSRLDLVTPAGIVRLLSYMAAQPDYALWKSFLPVAGVDGSLAHRFIGTVAAGRLRAKTGTLTHVHCLSGYVTTSHGEHLSFAIMVDNQVGASLPLLDRLGLALAQ